jgi:hypothetical protein
MPAGLLVTVPVALPLSVTARVGVLEKAAETLVLAVIVKVQVLTPVHPAPLQPAKKEPTVGRAVNVICVPGAKTAVQVAPQLTPAGLLVTVPLPLTVTVTERLDAVPAKFAVTWELF